MEVAIVCLLVLSIFFTGGAAGEILDYKATFHKNIYIGTGLTESSYIILKSADELEAYLQSIVTQLKKDTAIVPKGYWESVEGQIREFYLHYNKNFFATNNLVIAAIDQGSSSVSYILQNLTVNDSLLTVNIKRSAPLVQTMDYITWAIFLELNKQNFSIAAVQINLIN